MSEFDFLKNAKDDIPEDVRIYVRKSMDILDHLHELMEKNNINQRQLAERMGKKETEVSKWLNGVQNFTLKTLSKLEVALGSPIVQVPAKINNDKNVITIVIGRKNSKSNYTELYDEEVKNAGKINENPIAA